MAEPFNSGGRKPLPDGRFADPNGTIEEKYLHYFFAHAASERIARELLLENVKLVHENIALEKKCGLWT